MYHGLARRHLTPPRFLMRPLLNGGTLGGRGAMQQVWNRVRSALNPIAPSAVSALQLGASQATLRELENALGRSLPPDLAASLAVHDGQRPPYMSAVLFDNEYLLPSEQIISTWGMLNEIGDALGPDSPGRPSTVWWDRIFIPVTDSDGNGYCIDSANGAVFYHVHDGDMEGPLFDSWRLCLEDLAAKVERGSFKLEHGTVWLTR